MPVTKSAKKKLRADRKREKSNNKFQNLLDKALKTARKNPTRENVSKATGLIDKLAKKHLVHKNKAARIKSSLSKLVKISPKQSPKPAKKKTKSK